MFINWKSLHYIKERWIPKLIYKFSEILIKMTGFICVHLRAHACISWQPSSKIYMEMQWPRIVIRYLKKKKKLVEDHALLDIKTYSTATWFWGTNINEKIDQFDYAKSSSSGHWKTSIRQWKWLLRSVGWEKVFVTYINKKDPFVQSIYRIPLHSTRNNGNHLEKYGQTWAEISKQ